MNKAASKRAGKLGVVVGLLAALAAGAAAAQDIRASSMGRIQALSLESGQVVIEGRAYALEMGNLTVVHEGRYLEPGVLSPGMDVAFGVGRSSDGSRTVVRTVKILSPSAALGQED